MILVAIHGILTGHRALSWPDYLDAWLYRNGAAATIHLLKKEYSAGPFPRWNHLVRNRRVARVLTLEISLFLARHHLPVDRRVWLVAHSNGAVIALRVARQLIATGQDLEGLLLIGAACPADIRTTGIEQWLLSGRLGAAVAFASPYDAVLPGPAPAGAGWPTRLRSSLWRCLAWPYGALGASGWQLRGRPLPNSPRLRTRWFQCGHSGYFTESLRDLTFQAIHHELQAQSQTDCVSAS